MLIRTFNTAVKKELGNKLLKKRKLSCEYKDVYNASKHQCADTR